MWSSSMLVFPDEGTAKEDPIPPEEVPGEHEQLRRRAGTGANQGRKRRELYLCKEHTEVHGRIWKGVVHDYYIYVGAYQGLEH